MMKIMGKMGELKAKMAEAQEKIAQLEASGESGAGLVKARVNGAKRILSIEIDPSLLKAEEQSMVQALVQAAVNQAIENAEELAKEEMKKQTAGIMPNIPGLDLGAFGL